MNGETDSTRTTKCSTCRRYVADRSKHSDYVSRIDGQRYEMRLTNKGTVLVPVCSGHKDEVQRLAREARA